ncbi:MAG: DUF805 domain-containing protein [Prevotella sp.]|nr:DUF805 domain-containing protein [Prevotella sp.]
MGFTEAISTCFSKFATFSGRASRSEYWYWSLFLFLLELVVIILMFITLKEVALFAIYPVLGIIGIVTLLPSLAVLVRRLHDIGRSGWSVLFSLIPFVGSIIMLIFCLMDSQPGDNQYGPHPNDKTSTRPLSSNRPQMRPIQNNAPLYGNNSPSYRANKPSYVNSKPAYSNSEETIVAKTANNHAHLVFNGISIPLSFGRNIIGRKAETSQASIQIPADDLYMSRQHCVINISYEMDGTTKITLSNYQNKNRTVVNGKVINSQGGIPLHDGDKITLGRTTMTFRNL